MSMQHHLPHQAVRADPWTIFCPECSQKMRIVMATPAREGREVRTYTCVCGHGERIDVALHSQPGPSAAICLSTIQATKNRADPLQPSVRDAMLAAIPRLRAFAMSLSRDVGRADDLVQETLLRAIAGIKSFQPGTNLSAWMFTILHNLFRSEYRKWRREVEDIDGSYVDNLKSPPEQHSQVEFGEFREAFAELPFEQREALLLVGASGFSYGETAAICKTAVGTVKSRVNRARTRLSELLAIDHADKFGQNHTTRAVLTAGGRG